MECQVKDTYNAVYVTNIVFQAIFTLLWQIGLAILLSWVAVDRLGAPGWLYAVFITIGAITGFISMIRFILKAMKSLDRIEKERKAKHKQSERPKD
jgi:ABC-type multidrug transport system fused ATPase/permease subunit